MFQLYLLTVLTTILAGHALAREFFISRFGQFSKHTGFVSSALYRIVLAVLSILIGFINLFPTYLGNTAVLGDLLPSLAGIGAGILLLVEYAKSQKSATKTEGIEDATKKEGSEVKAEKISGPLLNIVGFISIVIGVLHALLPKAPLF